MFTNKNIVEFTGINGARVIVDAGRVSLLHEFANSEGTVIYLLDSGEGSGFFVADPIDKVREKILGLVNPPQ